MNYKKLELKLRRIVEKRLEEGWLVQPSELREILLGDGNCCALMVTMADPADDNVSYVHAAAKALKITIEQALQIENGFEGWSTFSKREPKFYAIGANIRRVYCDDNGEVE